MPIVDLHCDALSRLLSRRLRGETVGLRQPSGGQISLEDLRAIPGKVGEVTRPNRVVVRYSDLDMNEWEMEAEEFLARAICHELDHLDGHLYVEKVNGDLLEASELEEAALEEESEAEAE